MTSSGNLEAHVSSSAQNRHSLGGGDTFSKGIWESIQFSHSLICYNSSCSAWWWSILQSIHKSPEFSQDLEYENKFKRKMHLIDKCIMITLFFLAYWMLAKQGMSEWCSTTDVLCSCQKCKNPVQKSKHLTPLLLVVQEKCQYWYCKTDLKKALLKQGQKALVIYLLESSSSLEKTMD